MHLFPHHFSRSGGFCENPLRRFEVFTVLEVAPLGRGHQCSPCTHPCLRAYRDMSLSCSSLRTVEQRHSQPCTGVLTEQSVIKDLVWYDFLREEFRTQLFSRTKTFHDSYPPCRSEISCLYFCKQAEKCTQTRQPQRLLKTQYMLFSFLFLTSKFNNLNS